MLCVQVMKYKLATPMTGLDVGLKREWLIGQQLNTITGQDGELHGMLCTPVQLDLHIAVDAHQSCMPCVWRLQSNACSVLWLHYLVVTLANMHVRHAAYHRLLLENDTSMACCIAACTAYLQPITLLAQLPLVLRMSLL